jgi:hypothetical protein
MQKVKIILLLCALSLPAFGGDACEEVANAIRSGNSSQVASYFSSSVGLEISKSEEVYSKAQAELIVKDFFSKNPVKTFSVLHKGSSREGTLFAVGTFVSSNGKSFRTSFTLKLSEGKYLLQELHFEAQ